MKRLIATAAIAVLLGTSAMARAEMRPGQESARAGLKTVIRKPKKCSKCGGSGFTTGKCGMCSGSGKSFGKDCRTCAGTGTTEKLCSCGGK